MTRPVLWTYRTSIGLIGLFVLAVTLDGFAHSWAGIYAWGVDHGLTGWKAATFPGLVDLFILIGELGLFIIALEGIGITQWGWVDMVIAGFVAALGWGVSLAFNVGHVGGPWQTQATAAAAPIASMLGLLVLLRTLHRFVTKHATDSPAHDPVVSSDPEPEPAAQDPIERLIIAAREARENGVGAERIAELFRSRHYVEKTIKTLDIPQPIPASVNGHHPDGTTSETP